MFDVAMRVAQIATPPKVVQQTTASFQTVLQNTKAQNDTVPPIVITKSQAFIDENDTAKYDQHHGEYIKDGKLDAKELANGLAKAAGATTVSAEFLQQAEQMITKYNTPGDMDHALDLNELSMAVADEIKQHAGNDGGGGPAKGHNGGGGGGPASGSSGAHQSAGIWSLLMALIDTDGDGKISDKEAKEFTAKYGASVDKAELLQALKQKAAELGQSMPTDAEVDEFFRSADTHKSNDLDIAELTALKQPQQDAAA
jgi:hypothetical protein